MHRTAATVERARSQSAVGRVPPYDPEPAPHDRCATTDGAPACRCCGIHSRCVSFPNLQMEMPRARRALAPSAFDPKRVHVGESISSAGF